jgi:hypothetical protein
VLRVKSLGVFLLPQWIGGECALSAFRWGLKKALKEKFELIGFYAFS